MTCTFEGCTRPAVHENKAKDGKVWSNLCDDHNRQLNDAISAGSGPAKIVSLWVKCQGGSKKAADRVMEDFPRVLGVPAPFKSPSPEPIPFSPSDFEICHCMCHIKGESGVPMAMHCVACCEPCSVCGQNIKIGFMDSHRDRCRSTRPSYFPNPAFDAFKKE